MGLNSNFFFSLWEKDKWVLVQSFKGAEHISCSYLSNDISNIFNCQNFFPRVLDVHSLEYIQNYGIILKYSVVEGRGWPDEKSSKRLRCYINYGFIRPFSFTYLLSLYLKRKIKSLWMSYCVCIQSLKCTGLSTLSFHQKHKQLVNNEGEEDDDKDGGSTMLLDHSYFTTTKKKNINDLYGIVMVTDHWCYSVQ